jgi:hypothetical protein
LEINFWYEVDNSDREKVSKIWLEPQDIPNQQRDSLVAYIEQLWCNHDRALPEWLDSITIVVVGQVRKDELKQLYDDQIRKRNEVKKQEQIQIQSRLKQAMQIYDDQIRPKNMDKPMLDATMAIANAYDLYKYKQIYDNIYNSNSFTKIEHECIRIERNCPLAVSSLFDPIKSIIWLKIPEPKFIVLNVFPQKKDTIILLSYLGDHQKDLRPYADEIINASGEYQIYLLSKTILRYCENFVISPDHFNLFSQQKIDAIKNFYLATVTQIDIDHNDENLMLF